MLLELRRTLGLAQRAEVEVSPRAEKWAIEPRQAGLAARLREAWRYRYITWFFASRTVQRLYQNTTLGWLWLFIRPLAPIAIGALVFGRFLGVPSAGVPYFLFFLIGMMSWTIFEHGLMWTTRSLDMNKGLIKKVYFPRLIVPIAAIAPAVVDGLIYVAIFVGALLYYVYAHGTLYIVPSPRMLMSLLAWMLTFVFAIAVGLFTSIWQAQARDVRFTMRYFMRFWMYLTPVIYPVSAIPAKYQWMVLINPMAPIVEAFKWGLLGAGDLHLRWLLGAIGVIAVTLVSGMWYFTRSEATSVDKL